MPEPGDETRTATPAESPSTPVVSADTEPELPDMAQALRQGREEQQAPDAVSNDEAEDDEDEDEEAPAEQSPDEGSKPEQEAPAEERRLSRAERRRQELDALRAERDRIQAEYDAHRTNIARSQQEALSSLGSEDEWSRLVSKRLSPTETLNYDEEERYQALHQARQVAVTWRDMAWNSTNARMHHAATESGIQIDMPPPGTDAVAFAKQLIEKAKAQGRQELETENERLKADNQSLAGKVAGTRKNPGSGGRSVAGRSDLPDWDEADPLDYWRAGAEARERSRNGRR